MLKISSLEDKFFLNFGMPIFWQSSIGFFYQYWNQSRLEKFSVLESLCSPILNKLSVCQLPIRFLHFNLSIYKTVYTVIKERIQWMDRILIWPDIRLVGYPANLEKGYWSGRILIWPDIRQIWKKDNWLNSLVNLENNFGKFLIRTFLGAKQVGS